MIHSQTNQSEGAAVNDAELRKRIAQLTGRVERLERILVALEASEAGEPTDPSDWYRCSYGRDCTMPWTPHFGYNCKPPDIPLGHITPDAMTGEMEDTGTIVRGND
jgi:hypothetical protein